MRSSYRAGCPVGLDDLRYLWLTHIGFDGHPHVGELVVHQRWAGPVVRVFRKLYDARWPIERMRLVDDYLGDDDLSMADNNSSAYNCRRVAGSSHWSAHALGAAIDLNPMQNPYLVGASIRPPGAAGFADADRASSAPARQGLIRADDVVVRAFASIGWTWGGSWTGDKDYQHFAAPVR